MEPKAKIKKFLKKELDIIASVIIEGEKKIVVISLLIYMLIGGISLAAPCAIQIEKKIIKHIASDEFSTLKELLPSLNCRSLLRCFSIKFGCSLGFILFVGKTSFCIYNRGSIFP